MQNHQKETEKTHHVLASFLIDDQPNLHKSEFKPFGKKFIISCATYKGLAFDSAEIEIEVNKVFSLLDSTILNIISNYDSFKTNLIELSPVFNTSSNLGSELTKFNYSKCSYFYDELKKNLDKENYQALIEDLVSFKIFLDINLFIFNYREMSSQTKENKDDKDITQPLCSLLPLLNLACTEKWANHSDSLFKSKPSGIIEIKKFLKELQFLSKDFQELIKRIKRDLDISNHRKYLPKTIVFYDLIIILHEIVTSQNLKGYDIAVNIITQKFRAGFISTKPAVSTTTQTKLELENSSTCG